MRSNHKSCHIIFVDSFLFTGDTQKIICTKTQCCKILETSNAYNTADFPDNYEGSPISSGGYNRADKKSTPLKYTNNVPPSNHVISQVDVIEEMNETGDGRDSNDNCFGL